MFRHCAGCWRKIKHVWISLRDTDEKRRYKKVTLKDVARKAGVSYACVSAVLNNPAESRIRVSENTKQKILEAADVLGYFPDITARSLKGAKKSLIAVFTYEKTFPVQSDNEFYDFFVGVEEEAERLGYDLLIINRRHTIDDKFPRVLLADGAVVIGVHKDADSIKTLVKRRFPIVFIGRREFKGIKTDWITFDYEAVIYELVCHIYDVCGRSAVYLEDADSLGEAAQDKKKFLLAAASKKGLGIRVFKAGDDGYDADCVARIKKTHTVILSRIKQIEGFEAFCKTQNLIIGQDIFAAVLEDDWTGKFSYWTRWTNRRMELGAGAVNLLTKHIADCTIESKDVALKPELITGPTTAGLSFAVKNRR